MKSFLFPRESLFLIDIVKIKPLYIVILHMGYKNWIIWPNMTYLLIDNLIRNLLCNLVTLRTMLTTSCTSLNLTVNKV